VSPAQSPRPEDRPKVEERLHKMVQRWPEVSGCHLNPEPEVVEGIVQALVRHNMRYGVPYCPCRDLTGDPKVDKANICPCQFHRGEIERDGYCKCVLFVGDDYDPVRAYSPRDQAEQIDMIRAVHEREVTVYSTSWCFVSRRTKTLLRNHGIDYRDIDIESDLSAARQVETWNDGNRSVPTIVARMILTEPWIEELASILLTPGVTVMDVKAHITRWCSHSRRTLAWLSQHDLAAEVFDIERDPKAAARVRGWNNGNLSVPTLDVTVRVTEPSSHSLERLLGLIAVT
jgi:ferredoxin-thioredoxin reductase catalytic chain